MDFDAIEACCDGIPGGGNISVNVCLYLWLSEGMRDRGRVGRKWDRRGRYKWGVILFEEDIRECCPPKRPQLAKNKAALLMYGVRDLSPSLYMFFCIDSRDEVHPTSSLRDKGGLRDEKCSRDRATLCVVGGCIRPRDMGWVCAKTCEGSEDNAVAEVHAPHLDGREKRGCHRKPSE
jgi:hypothetical protein